jgi:hypothetical protein
MSRQALSLAVLVSVMLPGALIAQVHSVRGLVRDTDGKPVQGVDVGLENGNRMTQTDAQGGFVLDSLPAGRRRLLVRRVGFLPVRPTITVPQAPDDTLAITILAFVQQLDPVVVEVTRSGISGVVGDTAYRALPGTLVEVIGARSHVYTDSTGRFVFEDLKRGQYVLRISRVGYLARLLPINLEKRGQEYSIFLHEHRPGLQDWANTNEAAGALEDLGIRLAMEPSRYRMTRAELARYGTMALCEIPLLRSQVILRNQAEPNVVLRGTTWLRYVTLCGWSADQLDLIEWGRDPCREAWKSIAAVLRVDCNANPGRIVTFYGTPPAGRGPYVVIWPRS